MNSESDELRQLRAALRQSQRELAELGVQVEELESDLRHKNEALAGAWEELATLRHSTSWRITAPIRRLKASIR